MQNFGRINFWRLVARHAIGGEKFGESSTTGIHKSTHVSCLKIWRGLAGLDKSTKIFHHQIFALYGIMFDQSHHIHIAIQATPVLLQ